MQALAPMPAKPQKIDGRLGRCMKHLRKGSPTQGILILAGISCLQSWKVSLKKSLRDPLGYSRVDDLQLLNLSQMFAYSIFQDLQRQIPMMFRSIPVHHFY